MVKKRLFFKPESDLCVDISISTSIGEGWGCTSEDPGWGGMRKKPCFSGGAWL